VKIKNVKQNGFVLIIVIGAMAVIAIEMSILTHSSNLILFQSQAAYLEACEHNLTESGLAWAKLNIKNENIKNFKETIELKIGEMGIRRAGLSVVADKPTNKQAKIQISTSCSRGRQGLRRRKKYKIEL